MTGLLPCTCSNACQADSACRRPPRFQAHLDAAQDARHPRVHRSAEACASHLGAMVAALASWAHEHNLTSGDLTILIIEPPPSASLPRQPRSGCSQTCGLVFSTIRLGARDGPPAAACTALSPVPR
jgi:hypothetical protein